MLLLVDIMNDHCVIPFNELSILDALVDFTMTL